ncbi:MAG: polyphosphate polymerase domain-containing protein [Clostridia bacterium]|nr:polyphosphate polymerase domain-containing protein [Clostridia bacterium]
MAQEVFSRFEHKYLLDRQTYEKVIEIMNEHMESDPYNKDGKPYTISNIYFDTEEDDLIRTSLEKPVYKEKLRLRGYGVPGIDSKVYFEIKKKYKGLVNKRRTALTLAEAYDFAETGVAPLPKDYMNAQVLKEIAYFLKLYQPQPKVYLAYDRLAFYEKCNSDLRISFDTNIRTRRYNIGLEKGDYGKLLLPDDLYIMEIKTALAKPLWFADMLCELDIKRKSFSKYGTEFKQSLACEKEMAMAI